MSRTKLTDRKSIPAVIREMTLEEKISLLAASSACRTTEIAELGIPAIRLYDGATGVNFTEHVVDYVNSHPELGGQFDWAKAMEIAAAPLDAMREKYKEDPRMLDFIDFTEIVRPKGKEFLCFPSGVNIGASWDPGTAREIGRAVGWELRDSHIDICLGPNVDIQRDPLGGRNYEMYGEDPCLVGMIGSAFISGMQETGVGACAKHFIANNQETQRETKNNHVSERTLREIYSPGFLDAVKDGKTKAVMSAYSCLNGTFASYNRELLTGLLKEEWGFEGIVVSDWGAVGDDTDRAVKAGLDVILTGPRDLKRCREAVENGEITVEEIDEHVARILGVICDLKAEQKKVPARYHAKELLETACDTIVDGMVLLKNKENLLPLSASQKVSLWGKASEHMLECGTGSTKVVTALTGNFLDEMKERIGADRVSCEQWDDADVVVYTATAQGGEGADRERMDVDAPDREKLPGVLKEAKRQGKKTVVVLNMSGPVDMRAWIDDADAILCIFIPGSMGAKATARVICGEAAPGGRLPVTFPIRYEDTPSYPNFPGEHNDVFYGEGIFVGYRNYEKRKIDVQYPFGFGLTYSSFEQRADLSAVEMDLGRQREIEIPVSVMNTGRIADSQVIQLYVSECEPHLLRPVKELKAFKKIRLKPGEKAETKLTLRAEDLACFDPKMRKWVIPTGAYTLYLGTSSKDIFAEISMKVKGKNPYAKGPDSLFSEILKDEKTAAVLEKYLPGLLENEGISILGDRTLKDAMSMIIISYMPNAVEAEKLLEKMYHEISEV